MQRLKVEDQIQLADILKQSIQRLHENLNEIQQSQRGLGRSRNDNKVQRGVVAIRYQRRRIIVLLARSARGGCGR